MIVAIAGFKGTGKTTAAEIFVKNGFTLINFADPIKEKLFNEGFTYDQLFGNLKEVPYNRNGDTPRKIMQKTADFMKSHLGDDIFIKLLLKKIKPGKNYVIGDLRYPSELAAIEKFSTIVLIERDIKKNYLSDHSSETSVCLLPRNKMIVIQNSGTLEKFQDKIQNLLNKICAGNGVGKLQDPRWFHIRNLSIQNGGSSGCHHCLASVISSPIIVGIVIFITYWIIILIINKS